MTVLYPFRRPSMCRPVPRQCMRNEWLDVTTIVPATACHQKNDVEIYSRCRRRPRRGKWPLVHLWYDRILGLQISRYEK